MEERRLTASGTHSKADLPSGDGQMKTVGSRSGSERQRLGHLGRSIAVNCFVRTTVELDGPTLRDHLQLPRNSLLSSVLYVSKANGRFVRETLRYAEPRPIITISEGPPMVTVGGRTVDVVRGPSHMRLSHAMSATSALRHNAWTLEGFLHGGDLLHLVAVCKGLHVAV